MKNHMNATQVSGTLLQVAAVYHHVFGKQMAGNLPFETALKNILLKMRDAKTVQSLLNRVDVDAYWKQKQIKFS